MAPDTEPLREALKGFKFLQVNQILAVINSDNDERRIEYNSPMF
jgi:hypothetical protein